MGSERVEMDDIERAEAYEYDVDHEGRKRRHRRGKNGSRESAGGSRDKGKGRAERGYNEVNGAADRGGETVFALGDDEDGR